MEEVAGSRAIRRQLRDLHGFTLIELVVVVLVIGILAGLSIPRLDDVRAQAHFASIVQDFRNLGASQERYHQMHYEYAVSLSDLDFESTLGVDVEVTEATTEGWAAVGTHTALEDGKGCSIYLGNASAPPLPNGMPHTAGVGLVECAR
jgi:prepilin-type N-terminal cleavage/methylation domain-containing protein